MAKTKSGKQQERQQNDNRLNEYVKQAQQKAGAKAKSKGKQQEKAKEQNNDLER